MVLVQWSVTDSIAEGQAHIYFYAAGWHGEIIHLIVFDVLENLNHEALIFLPLDMD